VRSHPALPAAQGLYNPVNGWWSLIVYDEFSNFVDNPIDRCAERRCRVSDLERSRVPCLMQQLVHAMCGSYGRGWKP
jgi:hypothetical protein